MNKENNYLDERNDFKGPDSQKNGYPKRPKHVAINEEGTSQKEKDSNR